MVKPRFHERMGIPRQTLEKHHRQYLKGGLFDTPEIEGDFFHSVLREFGISKDPKNGWAKLAYELRLINMVMPDPIGEETKGKVELSHDCQRVANKLDDLARQAGELTHHTDVVVGLHALELNIADGVLHIMEMRPFEIRLNPDHPEIGVEGLCAHVARLTIIYQRFRSLIRHPSLFRFWRASAVVPHLSSLKVRNETCQQCSNTDRCMFE